MLSSVIPDFKEVILQDEEMKQVSRGKSRGEQFHGLVTKVSADSVQFVNIVGEDVSILAEYPFCGFSKRVETDDYVFFGERKRMRFSGLLMCKSLKCGKVVEFLGQFQFNEEGQIDGRGVARKYSKSAGFSIVRGTFKNSKLNGKGQQLFESGQHFRGDFVSDKFEGFGVFRFDRNSYYRGYFKNHQFNGYGEESYAGSKLSIRGFYDKNRKNGVCVVHYPDGGSYRGEFLDDRRHGYGELQEAGGDYYNGHFFNDQKHGIAVYGGLLSGESGAEFQFDQVVREFAPEDVDTEADQKLIKTNLDTIRTQGELIVQYEEKRKLEKIVDNLQSQLAAAQDSLQAADRSFAESLAFPESKSKIGNSSMKVSQIGDNSELNIQDLGEMGQTVLPRPQMVNAEVQLETLQIIDIDSEKQKPMLITSQCQTVSPIVQVHEKSIQKLEKRRSTIEIIQERGQSNLNGKKVVPFLFYGVVVLAAAFLAHDQQ